MTNAKIKIEDVKEISITDSINIENLPLLLLVSITRVAIISLPNLTTLVKKGELAPAALHATLENIDHVLSLAGEAAIKAPDTPATDMQGEIIFKTMLDFEKVRKYVLRQVPKVH